MLSDLDFIAELVAVDRLGREQASRRDVPATERLEYRQRRAVLLAEVADRTGDPADRHLAEAARAAADALLTGVE